MKQTLFIILLTTIISCQNQTSDDNSSKTEAQDSSNISNLELGVESNQKTKVPLDFIKNKDLLDIILLLPDSAFSTWTWSKADRTMWDEEIKTSNFCTYENPMFFNQVYFEPKGAGFSIVDGSWFIHIYKTQDNSFIVVTDDNTAYESTINTYEVKANQIKPDSNRTLISDVLEILKINKGDEKCNEKFEEFDFPVFEYHYLTSNQIELDASWYIDQKSFNECLSGNVILYQFNPKNKKFEFEKIYWKQKRVNPK